MEEGTTLSTARRSTPAALGLDATAKKHNEQEEPPSHQHLPEIYNPLPNLQMRSAAPPQQK
ncbi:MAG: hypothetical protein ACKPKO_12790, partial [Candidatus Fonsibacter sp.]